MTHAEPFYKLVAPDLQGSDLYNHLNLQLENTSKLLKVDQKHPLIRISIGKSGLAYALSSDETTPILATFISRSSFENSIKNLPAKGPISAIYADPAPNAQIGLAKTLLGEEAQVAFILSPATRFLEAELTALGVKTALVSEPSDIGKALKMLSPFDALLASPDPLIYNPSTLRGLISSLYRIGKPMLGYSPAFVKAGSLATTYSDQTEGLRGASDLALYFWQTGKLKPAQYIPGFDIAYNKQLGQSLGIRFANKKTLKEQVRGQLKLSEGQP